MAELLLVNPRRRRKSTTAKKRVRKNPIRSGVAKRRVLRRGRTTTKTVGRSYRRNPIKVGGLVNQVKGAGIGALGAFAVDFAMSKLPIPATMLVGPLAPVVRGAVGVAVGMLVGKVLRKPRLGADLTDGALTVQMYNLMKTTIGPKIGLAGYGDGGLLGYGDSGLLGYQGLGYQDLMAPQAGGMGYYNSAPVFPAPAGFDGDSSMGGL